MKDKDFLKLLGPQSFKKGNFFYDLHEKNIFNKKSFNDLINSIILYKKHIYNNQFIDKKIMGMLITGINIFSGIEEMYRNGLIEIVGLKEGEDLNDYYNELIAEIGLLLE